jgi:hypothetical protein
VWIDGIGGYILEESSIIEEIKLFEGGIWGRLDD